MSSSRDIASGRATISHGPPSWAQLPKNPSGSTHTQARGSRRRLRTFIAGSRVLIMIRPVPSTPWTTGDIWGDPSARRVARTEWWLVRARSTASERSTASASHGKADRRRQLVERLLRIDDLDRRHAHGPRRLQVDAQVIEEDGLLRGDAERLRGHLVDPGIGLAHPDLGRLDDDVEQAQDLVEVGTAAGHGCVLDHEVVGQQAGREPGRTAPDG